MLPSLCPGDGDDPGRVAVSCRPSGGLAPINRAYLPLAGSIGTRIVARLFWIVAVRAGREPRCRRIAAERPAGSARAGRWTQEGAASGRRLHGR